MGESAGMMFIDNEPLEIACRQCWGDDLFHCTQCGDSWCPTCENPCDCFEDDDELD